MTTYGVVATGFNRKPLDVILSEIEQSNIEIMGPGLIQTAQTKFGQWNGLRADLIAALWEIAQDAYQSYDPDQAEGVPLENLARLRLISRQSGELDASLRLAITNTGAANTRDADFYRAVLNVDGVTWARIYSNDTKTTDSNGMTANTVCVAALGGDDEEVATVARQWVIPGMTSYGNTVVSTVISGFCRSMNIMRPEEISIKLALTVSKTNDANNCPPPSNAAIAQTLYAALTAQGTRPANGQDITLHLIRTIVSSAYPNVQVTAATGSLVGDSLAALPFVVAFDEMVTIDLDDITVTAA